MTNWIESINVSVIKLIALMCSVYFDVVSDLRWKTAAMSRAMMITITNSQITRDDDDDRFIVESDANTPRLK